MKRRIRVVASIVCMGVLCSVSFAAGGPSSEVWLEVVEAKRDARVSVTVPLYYGFVVVGNVDSSDNGGISTADGSLLLPNVAVHVMEPSDALPSPPGDSKYAIQVVGDALLPVDNYSTDVRAENLNLQDPPREGLPVTIQPFLRPFTAANGPQHFWQTSKTVPTDAIADFKKFYMSLNGMGFSDDSKPGMLWLDGNIALEAPPEVQVYGYTAAGTARIPARTYLSMDVQVGGKRNQYKQVEESLKVGEIVWQVTPGQLN